MIKTTGEEDKHLLEAEFYSKPFNFSYSSLNRLLLAPNIFYKEYVLKEKPVRTEKHLVMGTLIHFLLLEGNNFDDHFIITPEALPSPNSMLVANEVIKAYEIRIKEEPDRQDLALCDFPDEILAELLAIPLHQNLKDTKDGKGDDKRIAKIVEPRTEAYFEYLKVKDTKEIIDSDTLDRASLAVEKIKSNEAIMTLLGMNRESDGKTFMAYNEMALSMDLPDQEFGLKGIIDNVTIDVAKKTISINDFKTSGKSLSDFPDTVEYWKYWLQATVYIKLARKFFESVIKDKESEWSIQFRFVVFDKYDHLYAYKVKEDTLEGWMKLYDEVIKGAKYHYESKDFTLPYEFAVGNVEL
jgi:hypothetical protein